MNHTFTITGARAIPEHGEHQSVLAKINWTMEFQRDGFTSLGAGETFLEVDAVQNFVPLEQVTKEQIVAWVIAKEGGDAFVAMLSDLHGKMIDAKVVEANTEAVTLPFMEAAVPTGYPITYNLESVN